jgi:hypothetical protein
LSWKFDFEIDKKTAIFLIVIIVLVLAIPAVGAAVYYSTKIRSTGRIKTVGCSIYGDPDGTLELSSIDWGTLEPGQVAARTVYIRIHGNTPQTLQLVVDNWNTDAARQGMTLTWDYDGKPIQPNDVRQVVMTLTVSQNIIGVSEFSFDITVISTG